MRLYSLTDDTTLFGIVASAVVMLAILAACVAAVKVKTGGLLIKMYKKVSTRNGGAKKAKNPKSTPSGGSGKVDGVRE